MGISGQKIKEMREESGLTQTEFGELTGVSKQQVWRYETQGIENMRVRRLLRMCAVFRCTPNDLLKEGGE